MNNINDPFFKLTNDTSYRACIGTQSSEEAYALGYINAALSLVENMIKNDEFQHRDLFVMPILYNARHGVELVLKWIVHKCMSIDYIKDIKSITGRGVSKSHDISIYYDFLANSDNWRKKCTFLKRDLERLDPFIKSFNKIDKDGQALRYFDRNDGSKSFDDMDQTVVDLFIVKNSLIKLRDIVSRLMHRIGDINKENSTETSTSTFSRKYIKNISLEFPSDGKFTKEIVEKITKKYGINSTQFRSIRKIIENHREFAVNVGKETPLLYLQDTTAKFVVNKWAELHPQQERNNQNSDIFSDEYLEDLCEYNSTKADVFDDPKFQEISKEEIADIEAIFYIAINGDSNGYFSEHYEEDVEKNLKEYENQDSHQRLKEIIIGTTNFIKYFVGGVHKLGRPSLALSLKKEYD